MKKTRLLEIIHEEIQIALNEKPIIGGPADIGLENGKVTKQPLSSALKDAIDTIKKEHPDKNEKEIASILVGKKARKSEDTSPEIKEKLKAIDDAVESQENLFGRKNSSEILKKLTNQGDIELSDTISKFIDGDKEFSDNLQKNQTTKFVKKTLEEPSTKKEPTPSKSEPTTSKSEPKAKAREKDDEEKEAEAAVGTDSTAKSLGAEAERMAQVQKFMGKMKDEGVVGDDNKILDAKKYKEEFAKFKAKLK